MILPIVAYGASILKKPSTAISQGYPELDQLITNMWDTLYNANGCGLAAPQVNMPLRLFIIDSIPTYASMTAEEKTRYFDGDTGIKEVFINPRILGVSSGQFWDEEEGCLSIPGLSVNVTRPWQVSLTCLDQAFQCKQASFSGMTARMILHEYDHLEGKLYLDYLSPLKVRLLRGQLDKITSGKVACKYPLLYPTGKKHR